jgi:N-acetylneuraminic acid mutarotase
MAYDSESDRTVLFSGWMATNDTWAYDLNTNTWTEKTPVKSPQTRFGHRMVYDAESDKVILFGGWMNFEDTWSYDFNTNTWENMNPSVHPSARAYHTMTYDAESDRVILFGGGEPGSMPSYKKIFNETWAYDYNSNTWANMNPENQPSSRVYAGMVYADESDRIILFGGGTHSQGQEDIDFTGSYETWIYDFNSNVWTKLKTKKHPSPRKKHVMCYDMESDNILLFSGQVFTDRGFKSLNNETWTFKY